MIAIGSDHAGFELKEIIKSYLESKGLAVKDFGCASESSVNYPEYAKKVSEFVADKRKSNRDVRGILICGSGIGMSIVANKTKGIRAALCHNEEYAKLSRQHNNANIICMGGRFIEADLAKKIIDTWLNTKFEGGRHQVRVDMIE